MPDKKGNQERRALDAFLTSEKLKFVLPASSAAEVQQTIGQYPFGRSSPPDFRVQVGDESLGIEVLQAMLENRDQSFQRRTHAQASDASKLEADLRLALPDCTGWTVLLSGLPPRRQLAGFRNALIEELRLLCTQDREEHSKRVFPHHPYSQHAHVVFHREERGRPIQVQYGFTTGVDYAPLVANVVRHLQTLDSVADQFTDLVMLIHDVEGLIGSDLDEFSTPLSQELENRPSGCSSSFPRLRGVYVVHEAPFWSTVPPPPGVERAWPRLDVLRGKGGR